MSNVAMLWKNQRLLKNNMPSSSFLQNQMYKMTEKVVFFKISCII